MPCIEVVHILMTWAAVPEFAVSAIAAEDVTSTAGLAVAAAAAPVAPTAAVGTLLSAAAVPDVAWRPAAAGVCYTLHEWT